MRNVSRLGQSLLVVLIVSHVHAENDERCCWCGKRYVAKEGNVEDQMSGHGHQGVLESHESASEDSPKLQKMSGQRPRALAASMGKTREDVFPFGFFVSWGGWLAGGLELLETAVGNHMIPVSPFEPGGIDAVEAHLQKSDLLGLRWTFDLQHVYRNETALREQVSQFQAFDAIHSWYLADEPDGAGNIEGPPVGVEPAEVYAAYRIVKEMDPKRPVLISLNCMHSAKIYQHAADIIMVDPYPISIDAGPCTPEFGCCGCDDCVGSVQDVANRLDHVADQLEDPSKPIWLVAQAFGKELHWSREPTPAELRCMTYLGLQHGASGIVYWLQTQSTSPLIDEVKQLAEEVKHISSYLLDPAAVVQKVTLHETVHSAWLDVYTVAVLQSNGEDEVCAGTSSRRALLLVTNTRPSSIEGSFEFSLQDLGLSMQEAKVEFESHNDNDNIRVSKRREPRTLRVSGGLLVDNVGFPPFGTRVYEFEQ